MIDSADDGLGKSLSVEAPDERTRHDEAARRHLRVVEHARETIEQAIASVMT